jgi:hypothetical protein
MLNGGKTFFRAYGTTTCASVLGWLSPASLAAVTRRLLRSCAIGGEHGRSRAGAFTKRNPACHKEIFLARVLGAGEFPNSTNSLVERRN